MKRINLLSCLAASALIALFACGGIDEDPSIIPAPDPDEPSPSTASIIFGSDVSWVTEMEHDGKKFKSTQTKEADLFDILKDIGNKVIRLRAFVDPTGGWCGTDDVVAKAKRAKDAGLSVMIDLHYSDFFADPGKQDTPAAWVGKSHTELVEAVKDYTKTLLNKIKAEGITPEYIQIGNETRNGMLWPDGKILWADSDDKTEENASWVRYAELSNAGYNAAKQVFTNAKIIIHLNHAFENNLWWYQKFSGMGGKYDVIGLSHYPQTDSEDKTWETLNSLAATNIYSIARSTNKEVFVVETGILSSSFAIGATVMKDFINRIKTDKMCLGLLYWEPEVYGGWKPAIYNTLGWGPYNMGAFTSTGVPSDVIKLFSSK